MLFELFFGYLVADAVKTLNKNFEEDQARQSRQRRKVVRKCPPKGQKKFDRSNRTR